MRSSEVDRWGRTTRDRTRRAAAHVLGLTALALLISVAPASANHSYPATYSGSAASGGSIEFDVSPDGGSVTRFALKDVPTTCGTVSSETMGNIPIVNHAFNQSSGSPQFNGSFSALQQAQGSLTVRSFFPSCTSDPVAWTASTASPPPAAGPGVTPAGDQTAYSACVRKANRAFKKARQAALRARKRARTKQAKHRAKRRLKAAIKKRKKAVRTCATLR